MNNAGFDKGKSMFLSQLTNTYFLHIIRHNMSKKKDNLDEEELEFIDTPESNEEETLKDKIKSLKEKITALESESKANLDGWQRARAELINKDRQIKEERLDIYRSATAHLVEELIPALDAYEMAKKNLEAWEKVDKNWRVGVEYIFTKVLSTLESNGLKTVEAKVGDKFDLNNMHSVEDVATEDESKDHTVSEVLQTGYLLNGKLIREAKVKVFVKK
jgi:molecular chaperone GrpE